MDNSKQKNKFIELLKIIFKRTRITTILLLLVTFASSTFAWFIYMDKVSSDIDVRVKAWNVSFRFNNQFDDITWYNVDNTSFEDIVEQITM